MTKTGMGGEFQGLARIALALILVLIDAVALEGQQDRTTLAKPSARQTLVQFEESAKSGSASLSWMLRHPEKYSRATLDSVVDGLERLALESKSDLVSSSAAAALASAGSTDRPLPGSLQRTLAVYKRSGSGLVRRVVLGLMYNQHDRAGAIVFLKSVASQDPARPDFADAPLEAVSTLSYMGLQGRIALSELRSQGVLRDPAAKGFVDWYFAPRSGRMKLKPPT